jgi:NADPH-dependent 2,4-dienoyl-CoA reductase/sulfur reductase-like enzyme
VLKWPKICVSVDYAVTLIDMADQVLAPVDYEMAQIVHEELTRHGVRLILKRWRKIVFRQWEVRGNGQRT